MYTQATNNTCCKPWIYKDESVILKDVVLFDIKKYKIDEFNLPFQCALFWGKEFWKSEIVRYFLSICTTIGLLVTDFSNFTVCQI